MHASPNDELHGSLTSLLMHFARSVLELVPKEKRKEQDVKELERLLDLADEELPCEDCGGKGWGLFHSGDRALHVERCDTCTKYRDDGEAEEAAELFLYVCEPLWLGLKRANKRKMRFRRTQRETGKKVTDV